MTYVAKVAFFWYYFVMFASSCRDQSMEESPTHVVEPLEEPDVLVQHPAKVVLFNDEVHTFEEVIGQIIKATGFDLARAEAITWEVHTMGKAVVYEGEVPRCVQISAVLEEIDLMTQIEF